jgi:hypothetical protein
MSERFCRYCLKGLEAMYIPEEGTFASSYRLSEGTMVHFRDKDWEYKYTMNCLPGLHQLKRRGIDVFLDVQADYNRMAARADEQFQSVENIAATVWTGNYIGARIPKDVTSQFDSILKNITTLRLTAQALAWMIVACLECGQERHQEALQLAQLALKRFVHPDTSLVRHVPDGFRRDWASFAASCYMAYAFLRLARETESEWANTVGLRIARAIVQLQGRHGQWAWFYHVPSGKVADYYPVYSVHQHAMAPLFLLEAIDHGYVEFREPLLKGFRWVLGHNELERSMTDNSHHVIWRSVVRREPLGRLGRYSRIIGTNYGGLRARIQRREALQVNKECRSYELGWALFAFAGRDDFSEILDDSLFV